MIARRLTESVLYLETRSRSDADREYTAAIRRIIEEHALMRETLVQISHERDIRTISRVASSALRSTAGNQLEDQLALRASLEQLSSLLPSDEQLHELFMVKSLIRKVLGRPS